MASIRDILKNSKIISSIYWKHIYCPAVLQMDLSKIEPVSDTYNGYKIKELSYSSPLFDKYLTFINVMYEEKVFTKDGLLQLLINHYWLKDVKTYVMTDDSNRIVATISKGVYKENEKWGGLFRFAVDKTMRKQGLGVYMLRFGYGMLKNEGCLYVESIVSYKKSRIPSLMAHFKCGFKPQLDRRLTQLELVNERGGIKHLFTKRWVMKYYRLFLSKHKQL